MVLRDGGSNPLLRTNLWGYNSVGRVAALQAACQEFESPYLHHFQFTETNMKTKHLPWILLGATIAFILVYFITDWYRATYLDTESVDQEEEVVDSLCLKTSED